MEGGGLQAPHHGMSGSGHAGHGDYYKFTN